MAIPLVYMLPNSTTLALAGSWNSNPGDKRMNKTTATTTGPQSAPISLFGLSLSLSDEKEIWELGGFLLEYGWEKTMMHYRICRRRNESNFLGGEGSDGMLNLERKKTESLKERKGMLC